MNSNKSYAETQRSSQSSSTPHSNNKNRRNRKKNKARGAKSKSDGRPPCQTKSKVSNNPFTPQSSRSTASRQRASYAARINSSSSALTTPTHAVKVRSATASCSPTAPNQTKPRQSQHGNMSKEEMLNVRMYQRDICYVAGLPLTLCTRIILGSKKWFGQFGRIRDITITDNHNCLRTNWMCAHIKYYQEEAATKAVEAMNGKMIEDGRILEANYGTQRYCEHFIYRTKCPKSRCPFRHSWAALHEVMNLHRDPSASPKKTRRHLNFDSNDTPRKPPRIQVVNTRSDPNPRQFAVKVATPKSRTPGSTPGNARTPTTSKRPIAKGPAKSPAVRKAQTPQHPRGGGHGTHSAHSAQCGQRPPQKCQQRGRSGQQHGQQRGSPVTPIRVDQHQERVSPASSSTNSLKSPPTSTPSMQKVSVSMEKAILAITSNAMAEDGVGDDREASTSAIAQNVDEHTPSVCGEGRDDDANRAEYNQSQPRTVESDVAVNYVSSDVGSEHVEMVVTDEEKMWMQKRIVDMEQAMAKQQEVVEAYRVKYREVKGAWASEKGQVSELTKITRCLIEERKTMCSKYDRISMQYNTMQQQHASMQQENQSLRQKVKELEKEIARMAASVSWSQGTVSPHDGSGRAGHPMNTVTPRQFAPLLDPYSTAPNGTMIVQRSVQQQSHQQSHQVTQQQVIQHQPQHHNQQQPQQQQRPGRAPQGVSPQRQQGQMVDYHLWQWHDVYRWMISMPEGRMMRYASVLQSSLKQDNVDGNRLKSLNVNDLHRIGITDFEDKQIVLQHIGNLQSHLDHTINGILDDLNI